VDVVRGGAQNPIPIHCGSAALSDAGHTCESAGRIRTTVI
jgi:hypothetical protein